MFNIESAPPLVSLVGSPFVWRVFSDYADNLLKIMAEPVDDFFELLPVDQVSKIATFELSEYFFTQLQVSLQLNEAVVHPDACKEFYVKFYQYYGNPPESHDMTGVARWLLAGKIPKWKQLAFYNQFNSFYDLMLVSSILSFYPHEIKKILPEQPEVVYFIAPAAAQFTLVITITFDDNTSMVHRPLYLELSKYQVGSFPVGYEQLNLSALSEKKIMRYVIEIENAYGSRIYELDYSAYRDKRFIVFRNSLGGYDTLACTGEADENSEIERIVTENVFDAAHAGRLNKSVKKAEETEIVKVNTGWLLPDEKNWLNDLVIATEVYELKGNTSCPVMIKNTSMDRTERNYEPGSVELEYERLYIIQ